MSYCETQSLAIGYGAPLLRDISLQAECGRILALIGPNGAGKSTLLKTLAGQLAAQSGAVLLDGKTLTTYTPNARARKLALMLPHTARTELTTCFDVAAAGRYPYTGRLGILSDEDKQQVRDALHLVQADELAARDFTKISDGQRQRVLLARAVCQQPEILLLDEPTSFLDVKGKAELMAVLQTLAHEKNVAIIVTLHELELAQKLADAVVCVSPQGVSSFINLLIILLQLFLVLRIAIANHTDRRHAHPQQVGVSLGGISLEVAMQNTFPLGYRQLIIRAGKVVHADKLISRRG